MHEYTVTEKNGHGPESINIFGIELISRYKQWPEYADMLKALFYADKELLPAIKSIFCDSKACALYEVTLHDEQMQSEATGILIFRILEDLDSAFIAGCNGANGISVAGSDQYRDASWIE